MNLENIRNFQNMQRAISFQGFLPIRTEPSHTAGMISQILFGEIFTALRSEGSWMQIEINSDQNEAWVDRSSVQILDVEEGKENEPGTEEMMVILPSVRVENVRLARQLLLPAGSVLRTGDEAFKKISTEGWIRPEKSNDPGLIAEGLLSIPALQGGRCGFGIDAPGLVQLLCRSMDLLLPHSIRGQAETGKMLSFIHEAQKGDLAFFQKGDDQFTHVGMVLDKGRIVHVTDQIRIDRLDQQGIYCAEKEQYTHQLRFIKSIKS